MVIIDTVAIIIFIIFIVVLNTEYLKTWDVERWFQNFPLWSSHLPKVVSLRQVKLTQIKAEETTGRELNGNSKNHRLLEVKQNPWKRTPDRGGP